MHKKVRLRLSDEDTTIQIEKNLFPSDENHIEIVDAFYRDEHDDYPPTLKDISIIMHAMVGNGVTWQLAYELSKRVTPEISKNPYELSEILSEIFIEYFEMSEENAWKKFEEYPRLHEPQSPSSTDYDV